MNTAATDKLARWVSKRDRFDRRSAYMAVKSGSVKTVADFDEAIESLLAQRIIALAPEQPSRGVNYIVTAHVQQPPAAPANPEPASSETRVAVETPVSTPPPVSDADVLTLAASRRRFDGRVDYMLCALESKHGGKRVGDLFKVGDLTTHDRVQMMELRSYLFPEPTFSERFTAVALRIKELPSESPRVVLVRAITNAVRERNHLAAGAPITSGYVNLRDLERLEAILSAGD